MKIKSIISICNAEKGVDIYGVGEKFEQFFSCNNAMYLMVGLPKLDEAAAYMLFGIPVDKRDKFEVSIAEGYPHRFDLYSSVEGEVEAARGGGVKIKAFGGEYEPIGTSQGAVFIATKYLAPFDDLKNGIRLYERIDKHGKIYFAVKEGFMLVGIIRPEPIIDEWLCNSLSKLSELVKVANGNGQGVMEDI